MMDPSQIPPDAELVDFRLDDQPVFRARLSDGSVVEFKVVLSAVFRAGNDTSTGMPLYTAQSGLMMRVVEPGPGTRRVKKSGLERALEDRAYQ